MNEMFEENYILENILVNPPQEPKSDKAESTQKVMKSKKQKKSHKKSRTSVKLVVGHMKMNESLKRIYSSICKHKRWI